MTAPWWFWFIQHSICYCTVCYILAIVVFCIETTTPSVVIWTTKYIVFEWIKSQPQKHGECCRRRLLQWWILSASVHGPQVTVGPSCTQRSSVANKILLDKRALSLWLSPHPIPLSCPEPKAVWSWIYGTYEIHAFTIHHACGSTRCNAAPLITYCNNPIAKQGILGFCIFCSLSILPYIYQLSFFSFT